MTVPEASEHLEKARKCLTRACIILDAGIGEDAWRDGGELLERFLKEREVLIHSTKLALPVWHLGAMDALHRRDLHHDI